MTEIRDIAWMEINAWISNLAQDLGNIDLIVGIARSGVPIATAFSYALPNANLSFATRISPRGKSDAFYIFDGGRESRFKYNQEVIDVTNIPEDDRSIRVLLVDDVATFGDTLTIVKTKLAKRLPKSEILIACYALDSSRLSESRPELVKQVMSNIEIDNEKVWLKFPWQLDSCLE